MRLLIVEKEPLLADFMVSAFRANGYAVDRAADGEHACDLAEINAYDIVTLAVDLPGMDGFAACRRLRARCPHLLIVMLTARADIEDRITGLDVGADDYLTKPFSMGELAARLRALLRRDMRARSPLLRSGDLALDPATHEVRQGERVLGLTRKEFGILDYLLRHPGEVISQEDLLEHVWDAEANPFTNTVRVHIAALRRKLGDTLQAPRYLETVVGQGYRLKIPASLTAEAS